MKKYQKGASLIEVLVTVLLLATSLLALAALQTRSLQYNHSAYLRSQANILAYDIIDRMRINRVNLNAYEIEPAAFDGTTEPSTLADKDLYQWRQNIDRFLPAGKGGVSCNDTVCTITVTWYEQDGTNQEEDSQTFSYSTQF